MKMRLYVYVRTTVGEVYSRERKRGSEEDISVAGWCLIRYEEDPACYALSVLYRLHEATTRVSCLIQTCVNQQLIRNLIPC